MDPLTLGELDRQCLASIKPIKPIAPFVNDAKLQTGQKNPIEAMRATGEAGQRRVIALLRLTGAACTRIKAHPYCRQLMGFLGPCSWPGQQCMNYFIQVGVLQIREAIYSGKPRSVVA